VRVAFVEALDAQQIPDQEAARQLHRLAGDDTVGHELAFWAEEVQQPPRAEFVFGTQAFTSWSRGKYLLDAALDTKLAPWTLHDLRRSVATGMAELGVAPHIVEAVLNHVSGHKAGVAGVYNRAT
jgi:integrase